MSAAVGGVGEVGAGDDDAEGVRGVCTPETGAVAGAVRESTKVGGAGTEGGTEISAGLSGSEQKEILLEAQSINGL